MSAGCDGPFRVRVLVPAEPAIVRVPVPAAPAVIRVPVPGTIGPAGPPGTGGTAVDLPFTATSPLSGHRAVYAGADGSLAYASADLPASADAFVGITTVAAGAGGPLTVRTFGEMVEPSWGWTPGPIYLGLAGALTQVEPMTGVLLAIATALDATRILINPDRPIFFET